jgi:hypothetical protein
MMDLQAATTVIEHEERVRSQRIEAASQSRMGRQHAELTGDVWM